MKRQWLQCLRSILFFGMFTQLANAQDAQPNTELKPITREDAPDPMALLQFIANRDGKCDWGYWGMNQDSYHGWTNHSNRLIPVYTFGATLDAYTDEQSVYRREDAIRSLYGRLPPGTLNPNATYADQTDIYRLQKVAIQNGKKYVFLIVFDGMDWQTTWAAATYRAKQVKYHQGRGSGLEFQDYRAPINGFGSFVTSPYANDCDADVDAQQIKVPWSRRGGYFAKLGGEFPWSQPNDMGYLISKNLENPDSVTDSSSSATSLTAGIKTFNGAINVTHDCRQVETIAHWVQRDLGFSIGAVTSVPISHATPASSYAHNVSRDDYQDLTRDMLGLRSVSHRTEALPGMDVVIGTGWGLNAATSKDQGNNFIPGNRVLTEEDRARIDVKNGGKYVVAERTANRPGNEVLRESVQLARQDKKRLLGFFGTTAGHLPYQTANGDYLPTRDAKEREAYTPEDILENPTLRDMTEAAIDVLSETLTAFG